MAWLLGWTRRRVKVVNNLTTPDYQMQLMVHKSGLGPDTYTDIYLGGYCRDDFADLRFTGPDQTTLLSYWIESITGTTPNLVAVVWIKVPTLTPINNIYIYYDNPIAIPVSNGTNTFLQWHGAATSNFQDSYIINPASGFIYETYAKASGWGNFGLEYVNWQNQIVIQSYPAGNVWKISTFKNAASSEASVSPHFSDSNFHKVKIFCSGTNVYGVVDTVQSGNISTNFPTYLLGLYLGINNGIAEQTYSFVRKYASPEPTFGVSGTEELNITATNMNLNTNTCTGPCQIIADVTWQNIGGSSITFTPAILIDGTTISYAVSNITIGPYPATGSSTITTPTLSIGTHTVCPYPN